MASSPVPFLHNPEHRMTHSSTLSRLPPTSSPNVYHCRDFIECDMNFPKSFEACHGQSFEVPETASEDSCTRHRQLVGNPSSVRNNGMLSGYFSYEIPPSRSERQQLRRQLKQQLSQVIGILSRIEAREMDIRTCLELEGSTSKSAYEIPKRGGFFLEKPIFSAAERPKSGAKHTLHMQGHSAAMQEHFPAAKRPKAVTNSKKIADIMRQCGTILKKLRSHKYGWIFNEPVDVVKLNIPDYLTIIKHPMDLGTIKIKLDAHFYSSPIEFAEDIRLTFSNAMTYNPKGHDVHHMADILLRQFEDRWKPLDAKIKQLKLDDIKMNQSFLYLNEPRGLGVSRVQHSQCPIVDAPRGGYDDMTFEQKQDLSQLLEEVPFNKLDQVMKIIERETPDLKPENGELTIDIDKLKNEALWELYNLLTESQMSKQPESGEITQMLPPPIEDPKSLKCMKSVTREDNTGEEDIDIGFEMPAASFPHLNIERDEVVGSKCSSSSSGSGSPSSDSDSEKSSGSDSDADDAQSRGSGLKVCHVEEQPVGSGEQKRGSPTRKTDGLKKALNDSSEDTCVTQGGINEDMKGEQSPKKQVHAEPVFYSSATGTLARKVSPNKQLCAAFLKNRFADTILKAREKSLPLRKGNGTNPETFQYERKELERCLQKEKARLQAEAKAAEFAQQRAEMEAASRAREEREAERQAARLKLQQMEKAVTFDENLDVIKDLAMLTSVPSLGGANALECLGLFMKVDEEEDLKSSEKFPEVGSS